MPPFPAPAWKSIPISRSNLNLVNTLPVGQSFLWHRKQLEDGTDEFSRAIDHPPRVIFLRQTSTDLWYMTKSTTIHNASSSDLPWLKDYFQLGRHPELEVLYKDWRERDPDLFGSVDIRRAQGVRVLRQDPWECLVAFITSSNNHIPRITSLLHRLTETYGERMDLGDDGVYHLFPSPHALGSGIEPTLRKMGFGYRAGFLDSTLQTLQEKYGNLPGQIEIGLGRLREMDTAEVREELLQLKGVGRKVADCVMLMSMDKASSIPIDTHVLAIASRHPAFPRRLRNKSMSMQVYNDVQGFLEEIWGPLGGWCQAVLFAADLTESTRKPMKLEQVAFPVVKEEVASSVKRKVIQQVETSIKRSRSTTRLLVKETAVETIVSKKE